jgi:hypothetical protein
MYMLHPTFPEPVRLVTDRASGFRLTATGWGAFTIVAEVRGRDGTVQKLKHVLQLRESAGTGASPPAAGSAPASRAAGTSTIFLSHSPIDGRLAGQVSRELESRGMKVTNSATALTFTSRGGETTRSALEQSDAVIALDSDTPSNSIDDELSTARGLHKTVVHVRVGAGSRKDAATGDKTPPDRPLVISDPGPGSKTRIEKIADEVMQVLQPNTGAPRDADVKPAAKPRTTKTVRRTPKR